MDVFSDERRPRLILLLTSGWVLFLIANIVLANIGNSPELSFPMMLVSFILFSFSGFCWISAMVLIIKIKRPKRYRKETPPEPEIIEKPVVVEKKVIVKVPRVIEKKPEPKLPEGKVEDYFVASKELDKYHLYNCRWVKIIKSENRIYFKTKDQAKKAGYKICKSCKKKMR